MLVKGALEIALNPGPGFYSHLFLVEKAFGGWRPVIDLSHLNEFKIRHPRDDLDVYVFHPFPLVSQVVARVRE